MDRVIGNGRLGSTMARLPMTEHFRPRPIMRRWMVRLAGRKPGEPTEEEIHDAIRILGEGYFADEPIHDPLYAEAERLLMEVGQ